MHMQSRQQALLDILQQGLVISGAQQTRKELGERNSYIGLSDLVKYSECPRSAIAGKIGKNAPTLQKLIPLQRGHWFENGIADVLASLRANQLRQLELSINIDEVPLRAHMDFTLVWDRPAQAVRILELKTCEKLPSEAMPAHVFQVVGQISLLQEYWNKPVFNLKDKAGKIKYSNSTFPNLCQKEFNISLPEDPDEISLEGWLLYLSMKNALTFGPYLPSEANLDLVRKLAGEFWSNKNMCDRHPRLLETLEYAKGFSLSCLNCHVSKQCPKFHDEAHLPQWENAITKLEKFKAEKASLETQIVEIEDALKQAHALSGSQGWLNTGSHRFRVSTINGRKTLDQKGLKAELAEILNSFGRDIDDDIDIDALFARHETQGAPYSRLTINPI